MMATETWYIMVDNTAGDPCEIAPDAAGVLCHNDGRKVAYAPHGPRSMSVDPEKERAKAKPQPKAKDMKPADAKPGYQTRDVKTD